MKKFLTNSTVVTALLLSGCADDNKRHVAELTAAEHAAQLQSAKEKEMTLGVAQRDVQVGMSQADVATHMGSPNIVTQDQGGQETWIYDKISSESSHSGAVRNGPFGDDRFASQAGAASSTQKTLTIIIKFDADKRVQSMNYHASKF